MADVKRRRRAHGYSTYKRKDGRWGWAVTIGVNANGNPHRIQGICKTENLAQAAAIEVLGKHRAGQDIQTGRDKTVSAYLTEWLDLYIRPHREPKTVEYYDFMVRLHISPVIGHIPLRKLTAAHVQKMLNDSAKPFVKEGKEGISKVEVTRSTETIRGIRATLRSALTQAHKAGLVSQNVAKHVNTPKSKRKEPDYLRPEEINALLQLSKNHPLERVILVGLLTGMRLGEITGLTWDNVDFEGKTLKVRAQLQRIDGKFVLKGLKSDSAQRNLYIAPTCEEALKAELEAQRWQALNANGDSAFNPLNLVFLNPEGRPFDPSYVTKHLKAILASAGIRELSFHKLRHTAATLSLASGEPLTTVRDQLGHSQISITANIYGHAVNSALKTVAESLERVIGKG